MNLLEQKKLELELAEKLQQLGLLEKAYAIEADYHHPVTVTFFTKSLNNSMELLHSFREKFGPYKLKEYNCNNDYACYSYSFPSIIVRLFSQDIDNVIESLGQGKCKIVEETSKPETVKRVVCAL